MARNLRNAYAKRLLFKNFAEVQGIAPHLTVKGCDAGDSDVVLYFDSEDHFVYRCERVSSKTDSELAYKKAKILYVDWLIDWTSLSDDLINGYGLENYFEDKDQIYKDGKFVLTTQRYILQDSEGTRVWRAKVNNVGSSKINFTIAPGYKFPYSRLDRVQRRTNFPNQINENFDLFRPEGHVIIATGRNFITDSEDRRFYHTDFIGQRPPLAWLRTGTTNIAGSGLMNSDSDTLVQNKIASTYDCYGQYYGKVYAVNSTTLNLGYAELSRTKDYYFHYMTEQTDSERLVEPEDLRANSTDSDFPSQYLTDSDSRVVTNFTTWDGTEAPWKVFNDSENSGFKASLGVQTGFIGWKEPITKGFQYNLNYVEVRNTLATSANNRPYNFNIEKMDRYGVWTVIQQVRNFNGYVYSHTFDSEYIGFGFRVNVLACQPGFNAAINALEIKQIKFKVRREYPDIHRAGHGIFVTNQAIDYTFQTGDSDLEVSGLLIGAGGGGGDNLSNTDPYGAGGGGGGAIQIHSLILPKNRTYRLRAGRAGAVNTDGSNSYIFDATNNRSILVAVGGTRGGTANFPTLSIGGAGGSTTADSDNYVFTATRLNGAKGGNGPASGSDGQAGFAGHKIVVKQFVNSQKINDLLNVDICSGGGGGVNGTPSLNYNGGAAGGTSAGRGAGWSQTSTAGTTNRGGGGGGSGDSSGGRRAASAGGSGYAYLIFK